MLITIAVPRKSCVHMALYCISQPPLHPSPRGQEYGTAFCACQNALIHIVTYCSMTCPSADNTARDLSLFNLQLWPQELKDQVRRFDDGAGAGVATVEKHVCTRAAYFLGTAHSTFSWDILRMRVAAARASCRDGLLPMGNTP